MRTWWEERVLPRLVDVALSDSLARQWRTLVVGPASGVVLEVGFASGKNLPFYPAAVSEVLAVEPADLAWERAAGRIAKYDRPVRRVGLDGASLPLPDDTVDMVISTWTMCTIPHLQEAIGEFRRVLRPGGTLRFVEHVAAVHPGARRIQSRVQPLWGVVAGGCHLDRDIVGEVEAGGFDVTVLSPPDDGRFELAPFVAGVGTPRAESE